MGINPQSFGCTHCGCRGGGSPPLQQYIFGVKTHGSVAALQEGLGVPQQQPVVRIHDVQLGARLAFFVLGVRVVERLLVIFIEQGTLKHTSHTGFEGTIPSRPVGRT